jgi:hypothetical protein
MEFECYYLELKCDFRKMEWSGVELELHIAGVAHL